MAGNAWKWMAMDGNDGMTGNEWKWLEMDNIELNGWKWLEIAGNV